MELIIMGCFMIASFLIGLTCGIKISKEDKPIDKPVKIKRKKKEFEEVKDPIAIMLENIDNYDGTSRGQQDVPEDEEEW